jgi:HlyD family secretion protein
MNFFKKLLKRKAFWFFIIVAGTIGGYYIYKSATAEPATVRYVTEPASTGTINVSISATGQVSSTSQVEVKPEASGQILTIPVKLGDKVKNGQIIATLDSTAAQKTVRDARMSLESAKLSLQKLQQPADALSILQAKNSLDQAKTSKTTSQTNLAKSYDDAYTTVTNAFLDLPDIMTALQNTLMGNDANPNQGNLDFYADAAKTFNSASDQYRDSALAAYQAARTAYNKNFSDFKNTTRTSSPDQIATLVAETYATSNTIAEAVKGASNVIQFYNDVLTQKNLRPVAIATTHLNSLNNYTGSINSNVTALLAAKTSIENSKTAIANAEQSIAEKTASLAKIQAGTDTLDLKSSQLSVTQRENALLDAEQQLSDYVVRAPFAGIVAKISANVGDQASSGSSIMTVIADQQVADVSLNESDIAKIKVGQKATLAFDAIDELTLTGEVSSVDLIGTVSQGVVSYGAKIVFDTQDARVKSGMSTAAAILIDSKTDVIVVLSTAVKNQGGSSYVLVMGKDSETPTRTAVTTGLVSDSETEITTGIKEGDNVVTQTLTSSSSTSAQKSTSNKSSTNSLRGLTGGMGGPPGM